MQVRRGTTLARRLGALTAATAMAVTMAACGGSDDPGTASTSGSDDPDQVSITFAWWGSDTRQQITEQVIAAFEAEYPHITVQPDFTSWDSYFERLNVSAAGGGLPDVITQQERFLAEYASRGLLADLRELDIATDRIDPSIIESGEVDGTFVGIATGVSSHALVADPAIFAEAGVDLPDDTTWTWDEYEEIATAIAEGSDGTYAGVQNYSFLEVVLKIMARQNGEEVFDENGELGVSVDTVEAWFQRSVDLMESGGEPSASVSTEINAAGVEGSLPATGQGAMAWFWSNQLDAIQSAAGRELTLLRPPGEADGERTGAYLYPTMYYSVAESSPHPEEAALFVDFLINSTEAGELIQIDRGLPSNTDVREAILPLLSDADRVGADFVEAIGETVVDGTPVPPVGAGETTQITQRVNSDVLFGRLTPREAAERWLDEVGTAIS